jgi:hypothetical protein
MVSEPALEAALRDLGRHLTWPPTPDLVPAVRAGLEHGAEVRPIPRRPVRRGLVLAAAALLVLLAGSVALSPAIRAAFLRLFTLPGVRIEVSESPAEPVDEPSVEAPFLGRRVSLAEARREVPFPLAVPDDLGRPDEVYLGGGGDRALVTMAYRRAPNITTDPRTGYAVLLTQLRGTTSADLIKKTTVETRVVPVTVGGERGYFVQGEHAVYVLDPADQPLVDEARIAGNTLLWTRGEVTLRLEADVPLSQAVAIARTVR